MFHAGAVLPRSPALVQLLTVPRGDLRPLSVARELEEPTLRAGLIDLDEGTANEGLADRGLGATGRAFLAVGPVAAGLKVALLCGPMVLGKLFGLTA
jgi:hypothetical protein